MAVNITRGLKLGTTTYTINDIRVSTSGAKPSGGYAGNIHIMYGSNATSVSNNWTYIKRSDGFGECFKEFTFSKNLSTGDNLIASSENYPITFTSMPIVELGFTTTSGSWWAYFGNSGTTTQCPSIYATRPTTSYGEAGKIWVRAIGPV